MTQQRCFPTKIFHFWKMRLSTAEFGQKRKILKIYLRVYVSNKLLFLGPRINMHI